MNGFLLVGKMSFIGSYCYDAIKGRHRIDAISHREIDSVDLNSYACVLNMAYQPEYFHHPHEDSIDFALRLARRVADTSAHYVLMSTRRVYGTHSPFPASESAPLDPTGVYGLNSAITETKVRDLLGDRCTVVRGANVFGYEPGRHTFFGLAMSYLLEKNQLTFDFSPSTRRDFIPVENFAQLLFQVAERMPGGIVNIGSGHSVTLGDVTSWLLEGYASGEALFTGPNEFDAFQLDITRLESLLGPQPDITGVVREKIIAIGRKIREKRPQAAP